MPKPFFLARPSGLFVRFLVPLDLRATLGLRFIVRRLYLHHPDHARLAAARMAATLSDAFHRMRGGLVIDIKKILEQQRRGELKELTIGHAIGRDGTRYENVVINDDTDATLFQRLTEGNPLRMAIPGLGQTLAPANAFKPAPVADVLPLLSVAIENHKRERKGKVDPRGALDVANALGLFLDLTGDMPINHVKRVHVVDFDEALLTWPKNARKKREFDGKTPTQILKLARRKRGPDETPLARLSDRSRQKYRDLLAAFFNQLVNSEQLEKAPTAKVKRQSEHRIVKTQIRRPYKDEELLRIFDPATFLPWAAGKPHHFWGPWVALYSGARLNEVAQLYCDDVETFTGIPGFHVRNARPDQHIKTGSSCRFIPLAQAVLDAGFLRYVADVIAAKHERLFPHLKYTSSGYGDYLGDNFIRYLTHIGLKAGPDAPLKERNKTAGMGIHWFRNGLSTSLIHGGTTPHTTSSITGHSQKGTMPGELARYVDIATLPQRLAAVNSLAFPPLPKYVPGQFERELLDAHRLPEKWKRDDEARNVAGQATEETADGGS